MKRAIKWVGIALASVAGITVLAIVAVYVSTERGISKVYAFNDPPLSVPTDVAAIAKGQHFVQAIGKCAVCHGDNFAGKVLFDDNIMGRLYSANLTRGKGGIGGSFRDTDYVRAIRHGVGTNGRPLLFMPVDAFYYVNDEDLANTIAYLKTIPAVDAVSARQASGPVARALYLGTGFPLVPAERAPQHGPRPPVVAPGATVEYGEYLANTGGCRTCHLKDLSGGVPTQKNVLSANLTPKGIGKWTEADFRKALRDGIRPDGRILSVAMPCPGRIALKHFPEQVFRSDA